MEYKVTKGKTYLITAKDETTVTDVESGYTLKVVPANNQDLIVAISDKIETSGECDVRPFVNATRTHLDLNAGGNSAGGGEPEGDYVTYDTQGGVTGCRLDKLENGSCMFFNRSNLTSFTSDLPSLTNGASMFSNCTALTSWNIDLPSLTNGASMFSNCTALTSWNIDLPSLTECSYMFNHCVALTSFTSDLPSLTNGSDMFYNCNKLTSFTSDLPSLITGTNMFSRCFVLTSFNIDLPSLRDGASMFNECYVLTSFTSELPYLSTGSSMFNGCKLNKESAIRILTSLKTLSSEEINVVGSSITIGIHIDHKDDSEIISSIDSAKTKGWIVKVQWNGKASS